MYDLYPAVDADYNFPPEVRGALAKSAELKHLIVPMTTTQRNNLAGADLWDGRVILNTTTDRLNRYDEGTTSWKAVADQSDVDTAAATRTLKQAQDSLGVRPLSGGSLWPHSAESTIYGPGGNSGLGVVTNGWFHGFTWYQLNSASAGGYSTWYRMTLPSMQRLVGGPYEALIPNGQVYSPAPAADGIPIGHGIITIGNEDGGTRYQGTIVLSGDSPTEPMFAGAQGITVAGDRLRVVWSYAVGAIGQ